MSREITVTDIININKGEIKNRGVSNASIKVDQDGAGYQSGEVNADDVTPVPIPMDLLTVPGRYSMKCTHATGPALVGTVDSAAVFTPFNCLLPGEPGNGRIPPGVQPYLLAEANSDGNETKLEYFIAEA